VALNFILLLGIVSLFADMTYEGARSITGPYLLTLGTSAIVVGFIGGFGEFIGYGIRIVFGSLADRTGKYWDITIFGYVLNLLAVPLLALANHWDIAIALIIAERFGKAIRTPARDVMLSHAAKEVGRGWGFGLHEAMDQIGAVLGPLIVSIVLFFRSGGYSTSFGLLIVPAIIALVVLVFARKTYPNPHKFEAELANEQKKDTSTTTAYRVNTTTGIKKEKEKDNEKIRFPPIFWIYLLFVFVSVSGYANFQLISFHFKDTSVVPDSQIPMLFAIAMGTDALAALVIGRLFDKKGLSMLIAIPILTIPIAPLAFSSNYGSAVIGIIIWGVVMGIQDTIMRASIANMVPSTKRGSAYGIFNTAYGISWFLGSIFMGFLYEISIFYIFIFSIVIELCSIPLLFKIIKDVSRKNKTMEI
jgi:MFS family permease